MKNNNTVNNDHPTELVDEDLVANIPAHTSDLYLMDHRKSETIDVVIPSSGLTSRIKVLKGETRLFLEKIISDADLKYHRSFDIACYLYDRLAISVNGLEQNQRLVNLQNDKVTRLAGSGIGCLSVELSDLPEICDVYRSIELQMRLGGDNE